MKHSIINFGRLLRLPPRCKLTRTSARGSHSNSLHNLRNEHESHAAGFDSWGRFHECGNRRGMRMADCDGKSVTRGIACGKINLRENHVAIRGVVEKHLARCRTDARAL